MKASLEITGLDEAIKQTQATSAGLPPALEDGVYAAGFPAYFATVDYAPERPGSSYARTFNYAANVSTELTIAGDEIDFEIKQGAPYSIFLRGTADGGYLGAWMHVGRWRPLVDIVRTFTPVFIVKLQDAVDKFIRSVWGS